MGYEKLGERKKKERNKSMWNGAKSGLFRNTAQSFMIKCVMRN